VKNYPVIEDLSTKRGCNLQQICRHVMSKISKKGYVIELDDGKILTGKPDQFDGKNPWVSG